MFDQKFIRDVRTFLLQFNDLRDHAFMHDNGERSYSYDSKLLEHFRNHPDAAFREIQHPRSRHPDRVYRPRAITCREMANHFVTRGTSSVWIVNKANVNTLLMAIDVDDKRGTGEAQTVAEYLKCHYLGGRAYIETSTRGLGRHVYFKLDVTYVPRTEVWAGLKRWEKLILRDSEVRASNAVFGGFLGYPTIWENEDGCERIVSRGNMLKVPYLPNDRKDLQRLQDLPSLSFQTIMGLVSLGEPASMASEAASEDFPQDRANCPTYSVYFSKGDMGGTAVSSEIEGDAFKKKLVCVDRLLRATNGKATLKEVLDEYHEHYEPSGMTDHDIRQRTKKLEAILERRRATFQPSVGYSRPFRRGENLDLIRALVPASAFVWKRRNLLDHQRLADFVGVKMQDAFFQKPSGFFGTASRDATLKNMNKMHKKGLIDWTITSHQYTKLLSIAVEYKLLEIVEPHVEPIRNSKGEKVFKGKARVIGPGNALPELRAEFQRRYEAEKGKWAAKAA